MKLGHNHKAAWHALRKIGRATFNQLADEKGCEIHTAKKNIYRLRELGLAVMSAKSSNVMFFSAICNGEEIEFASYVKNRNDQAKRIYEAFIRQCVKPRPSGRGWIAHHAKHDQLLTFVAIRNNFTYYKLSI